MFVKAKNGSKNSKKTVSKIHSDSSPAVLSKISVDIVNLTTANTYIILLYLFKSQVSGLVRVMAFLIFFSTSAPAFIVAA